MVVLIYFIMEQAILDNQHRLTLPLTPEMKIFSQLFQRKFVSQTQSLFPRKLNKLVPEFNPQKYEDDEEAQLRILSRNSLASLRKTNSKSVGSLLPKLKELEVIQKSSRKQQGKEKKMVKAGSSLSKLDIYFSKKNIQKQKNNNIVFITAPQNRIVSDKEINDRFLDFVTVKDSGEKLGIMALLNLVASNEPTEEEKQQMLKRQKEELTGYVHDMMAQHHQEVAHEIYPDYLDKDTQQASSKAQEQGSESRHKDIEWVLRQCKQYDKKFKIKKSIGPQSGSKNNQSSQSTHKLKTSGKTNLG